MKCPDCNGTGKIMLLTSVETCKNCGGEGNVYPVAETIQSERPARNAVALAEGSNPLAWAHLPIVGVGSKLTDRHGDKWGWTGSDWQPVYTISIPVEMKVVDIATAGMYWIENGDGWSPVEVYEHLEIGGLHVHCMRHPGVFDLQYFKSEFKDRDCRRIEEPAE